MKTNLWLTVLTIALVLNAVMMHNTVDGDECTSGIRKEHLDPTPGAFVDGQTIQIGTNGLQVAVVPNIVESFALGTQTHTSTANDNWTDLTDLAVSITPTQASSKVKVSFSVSADTNSGNVPCAIRIVRDTGSGFMEIPAITPVDRGNRLAAQLHVRAGDSRQIGQGSFSFIDSPGVDTTVTYKLQATCCSGYVWHINRDLYYIGYDSSDYFRLPSGIRAEEIYMP